MFKIHVSYYLTFVFFKLATCHYLVSGIIGKISHKTTLAIAFFTMQEYLKHHSKIFGFSRQKMKNFFYRQISNACQRFIPPELKYEEPKSHAVEEGSYFPNTGGSKPQGQPAANNNHLDEPVEPSSSSVSTTSSSTTVTNNERQPKQDLAEEEIRAYSDNEGEDESINFDEFFDLAVYKNLLSSSPPQKMSQSGTSLLLFFAFILSMFMA